MLHARRACCTLAALLLALSTGYAAGAAGNGEKPSVALKATPPVGFSPLKVHASVEIRGGPNDNPELYCATVEWDWGDDLSSERSEDCDPYRAGESEIQRRYSADHTYQQAGSYRVTFRLKQKNKLVASGSTNVQVRAGIRDDFGG
jgi:hypothetical protein